MKPNDVIDYGGRRGVVQAVESDILYVYFHGHGVVKFTRDGHPIGGLPWEKAEADVQHEAPRNTPKSKNFVRKTRHFGARTSSSTRSWLH